MENENVIGVMVEIKEEVISEDEETNKKEEIREVEDANKKDEIKSLGLDIDSKGDDRPTNPSILQHVKEPPNEVEISPSGIKLSSTYSVKRVEKIRIKTEFLDHNLTQEENHSIKPESIFVSDGILSPSSNNKDGTDAQLYLANLAKEKKKVYMKHYMQRKRLEHKMQKEAFKKIFDDSGIIAPTMRYFDRKREYMKIYMRTKRQEIQYKERKRAYMKQYMRDRRLKNNAKRFGEIKNVISEGVPPNNIPILNANNYVINNFKPNLESRKEILEGVPQNNIPIFNVNNYIISNFKPNLESRKEMLQDVPQNNIPVIDMQKCVTDNLEPNVLSSKEIGGDVLQNNIPKIDVPQNNIPIIDVLQNNIPIIDVPQNNIPIIDVPQNNVQVIDAHKNVIDNQKPIVDKED